jgi:hypothetical protein
MLLRGRGAGSDRIVGSQGGFGAAAALLERDCGQASRTREQRVPTWTGW